MMNTITYKITKYIQKNSELKNIDDLEKMNYALQTIFNEIFKIIMLIILFRVIGNLNYFLFSMMILLSIRLFAGGLHAHSLLTCLMWTTFFFILTSIIAPLLPKLNPSIYYILSLLNLAIIVIQTPYPNPKRPIKNKKRRQYLKILAISFSIFWTYVLLFKINNSTYLNCGIATILLQSSQLLYIRKEILK
jgi:accessory gene regulator B